MNREKHSSEETTPDTPGRQRGGFPGSAVVTGARKSCRGHLGPIRRRRMTEDQELGNMCDPEPGSSQGLTLQGTPQRQRPPGPLPRGRFQVQTVGERGLSSGRRPVGGHPAKMRSGAPGPCGGRSPSGQRGPCRAHTQKNPGKGSKGDSNTHARGSTVDRTKRWKQPRSLSTRRNVTQPEKGPQRGWTRRTRSPARSAWHRGTDPEGSTPRRPRRSPPQTPGRGGDCVQWGRRWRGREGTAAQQRACAPRPRAARVEG